MGDILMSVVLFFVIVGLFGFRTAKWIVVSYFFLVFVVWALNEWGEEVKDRKNGGRPQ